MVFSSDTAPYQALCSVPVDSDRRRPLIPFDDPLAAFGRGAPAAHDSPIYFALR
jgi:hypothetical protein